MNLLHFKVSTPNSIHSGFPVRCAIYTRVSTDDQARGDYSSLDTQRDICQHAIALHRHEGWSATHFFDDAGFSGKNLERPGIRALLQNVRAGRIDVVVAYKLDRITRYLPDFYSLWKVLEQHGVHFVSATQSFDTSTPLGMLMVNMLLSFNQFERETTVERIQHKLAERAKRGMWNGGWAPFGYIYDPVTKRIGIHEKDAKVTRRIFELSREFRSPAKVAAVLNAEGLRTPERQVQSRRGRKSVVGGKRFISHKISKIVTNSFYKGIIRHNGQDYPGEHPALISAKLWQQANDALKDRKKPGGDSRGHLGRNVHQALLKGIVHCGICGHRLTPKASGKKARHARKYLYYTCNEVSKDGRAAACTVRNVPARALDECVIKLLGELGRHPEVIQSAIAASSEEKSRSLRPLKSRRAELQHRRKEISEALARYLMLARQTDAEHFGEETLAAAEDLSKRKHELERELEKIEIDILSRERVVADEERIRGVLLEFGDVIRELSFEDQCELVRLIVRGVRINRLNPEKNRTPEGSDPSERKMRGNWYSVTLEAFPITSSPMGFEKSKLDSHPDRRGNSNAIWEIRWTGFL